MGIINRNLSNSEKRVTFSVNPALTATGVTGIACLVPWPSSLDDVQVVAFGLSGAPNIAVFCNRFIAGTGFTSFPVAVGTSNLLQNFGSSGAPALGLLTPQIGSTLSTLQTNDVLMWQLGGTNSAVTSMSINCIIRPVNDIKKYYGIL